jgi:hypothetical protein
MGAAVSTLLAYIILTLVSYIVNQKIYPIGFEIGLFTIKLLLGTVLYFGASLLAHTQKPLMSWCISIATLILYGLFLMLFEGLSTKKLIKTFRYVRAAVRKEWKKTYA